MDAVLCVLSIKRYVKYTKHLSLLFYIQVYPSIPVLCRRVTHSAVALDGKAHEYQHVMGWVLTRSPLRPAGFRGAPGEEMSFQSHFVLLMESVKWSHAVQRLKEVCSAFTQLKGQLIGNFLVTKVSYVPPTVTSLSNSTPEPVQSLRCQSVEPTGSAAEWLVARRDLSLGSTGILRVVYSKGRQSLCLLGEPNRKNGLPCNTD